MRQDCPDNIVLVGMPGAGKSSIGVLLAKRLGYQFIDTDLLMQGEAHCRLQQIIAHHGLAAFRDLEERVVCKLAPHRTVIATGGSVVYSNAAMAHLQQIGRLVYLDLPLEDLQRRVRNMDSRGLVIDPNETFADLYARRTPLYRQYAEMTIPCGGRNQEEIAAAIEGALCGNTG
ncbi:MAG: shikimate kinase [Desulfuromonadales bacterium]|nr:shikimate kinase [Desulfuromonadales bacterium]